MRGANRFASDPLDKDLETSPHAWSKPFGRLIQMILTGNISTCVEQTHTGPETSGHHKKHLHMRGANRMKLDAQLIEMETSPHAWSKLPQLVRDEFHRRNISTCVEQTLPRPLIRYLSWKHLHMRGANIDGILYGYRHDETSPHAWSKLPNIQRQSASNRNISTCVEQTCIPRS